MFKTILLIVISETWNVLGQILFKKSANAVGNKSLRGLKRQMGFIAEALTKPALWLGIFSMGIALLIWVVALAGADLSLVSPVCSFQYIMVLILAHFFLGEKINARKLFGTVLVMAGIVLVVMG